MLARIENEKLMLEMNDPGVHPFITVSFREGNATPVVILGAKQVAYRHKGASFPRIICSDEEQESGHGLEVSPLSPRSVLLRESRGGFNVISEISLSPSQPIVHVTHTLVPSGDIHLNRAFDRYDFLPGAGEDSTGLDYHFIPHLRPEEDMVVSDFVFRSPVSMMEKDGIFFALIPDLGVIRDAYLSLNGAYYMDFVATGGENMCPAVCMGMGNTQVKGHVYFKGNFKKELKPATGKPLVLSYYLILDRDGLKWQDIVRFLWEKFADVHFSSGLPQSATFDRYTSAGLRRIFKSSDLMRRFEIDGERCGGSIGMHFVTRKGVRLLGRGALERYLRYQNLALYLFGIGTKALSGKPSLARAFERFIYTAAPRVLPQILFQSWFNNLRSAYGAYWFAGKWKDRELEQSALDVKNLVICAPREDGAFPSVCYVTEDGVFWSRGTQGFKHFDWYHTADCSTTGYYMLLWFRDHEGDPRLLKSAQELASFLKKAQLPNGAIPSWVRPAKPRPVVRKELKESATTACSAMFLALLYLVDGWEDYLNTAVKAVEFLEKEVIPKGRWFDFETFYSCSRKDERTYDRYSGTFPQNTMSMIWAAEAIRLLFLSTGDEKYLALGRKVLDHLCLYQQVWDPPFLSICAFGGFASQNSDAEWNDARQALVAPILMDYYSITGDRHYMERGIAALRASFTTMYIAENERIAPGVMRSYRREEEGSTCENYGHLGFDYGTLGYLEADWGTGSACQASAYVQKHYGDIFIDLPRERAFGINGCFVDEFKKEGDKIYLEVRKFVEDPLEAQIKVDGAYEEISVFVNGRVTRRTKSDLWQILL